MKNGFNQNQNKDWNKEKLEEKDVNPSTIPGQEDTSAEESSTGKYVNEEKDCNGKECR